MLGIRAHSLMSETHTMTITVTHRNDNDDDDDDDDDDDNVTQVTLPLTHLQHVCQCNAHCLL